MKEQILNGVIPVIVAGIVGVLVAIIKSVGDAFIKLAEIKIKQVEQKYNLDKYSEQIMVGRDIWNIVEEKFRITENINDIAESKKEMFDRLLLEKIPTLKQTQIEEIRQAIAGEVNKGKKVLNENILDKEKLELEKENKGLKDKLNQVQEVINNVKDTKSEE